MAETNERSSGFGCSPGKFFGRPGQRFDVWHRRFERYVSANRVTSDERKCDILPSYLDGTAETVYNGLSQAVKADYSGLVRALKQHFAPKYEADLAADKLMSRRQGPAEDVTDFAFDIQRLAQEAFGELDLTAMDILRRKHFMLGLLPHLFQSVSSPTEPRTFDEAVSRASAQQSRDRVLQSRGYDGAYRGARYNYGWQREQHDRSRGEGQPRRQFDNRRSRPNQHVSAAVAAPSAVNHQDLANLEARLSRLFQDSLSQMQVAQAPAQQPGGNSVSRPNAPGRSFESDRAPLLNRWSEDGSPICNHCHQEGHMRPDCPRLRNWPNGQYRSNRSNQAPSNRPSGRNTWHAPTAGTQRNNFRGAVHAYSGSTAPAFTLDQPRRGNLSDLGSQIGSHRVNDVRSLGTGDSEAALVEAERMREQNERLLERNDLRADACVGSSGARTSMQSRGTQCCFEDIPRTDKPVGKRLVSRFNTTFSRPGVSYMYVFLLILAIVGGSFPITAAQPDLLAGELRRIGTIVHAGVGLVLEPRGLAIVPREVRYFPVILHTNVTTLIGDRSRPDGDYRTNPTCHLAPLFEHIQAAVHETAKAYDGLLDTAYYSQLIRDICNRNITFCRQEETRHPRQLGLLVAGILGVGGAGLGIANSVYLGKLSGEVNALHQAVDLIRGQGRLRSLALQEILVANKKLYSYVHHSVADLHSSLERLDCAVRQIELQLHGAFALHVTKTTLRGLIDAVADSATTGKLNPSLMSVAKARQLLLHVPEFSSSLIVREPGLIYQLATLYPVRVDLETLTYAFLLEVPLVHSSDIFPVYQVHNVGWFAQQRQLHLRLSFPSLLAVAKDADGGYTYSTIATERCESHPGLWICSVGSVLPLDVGLAQCLAILGHEEQQVIPKCRGFKLRMADNVTQVQMTTSGLLIFTNESYVLHSKTDQIVHSTAGIRIPVPNHGVLWISHGEYTVITVADQIITNTLKDTQYVNVQPGLSVPLVVDPIVGVSPIDWTDLDSAMQHSNVAADEVQQAVRRELDFFHLGLGSHVHLGFLYTLVAAVIAAVIASIVCWCCCRKKKRREPPFSQRQVRFRRSPSNPERRRRSEGDANSSSSSEILALETLDTTHANSTRHRPRSQDVPRFFFGLLQFCLVFFILVGFGVMHFSSESAMLPLFALVAIGYLGPKSSLSRGLALGLEPYPALTIMASIQGLQVPALIDTGASITLVTEETHRRHFPQLPYLSLSPATTPRISSMTGHSLPLTGMISPTFQFGSSTIKHPCYVIPEAPAPCVLGADLLAKFGCLSIDFIEKSIKIGDDCNIPLPSANSGVFSLRSRERWSIPARSEVVISCAIPDNLPRSENSSQSFCFEPNPCSYSSHGLLAARALVTVHNGTIPVRIINPSPRPKCIRKGYFLGKLEPLTAGEGVFCTLPQKPKRVAGHVYSAQAQQIPPKSDPTWLDLSGSDVTPEQRGRLSSLISTYENVFAKNDNDLGLTSVLAHSIDVGNARPSRQRPYRLPLSKRQAVEAHVQRMQTDGLIRPSCSPWSSPIVLVGKKDGTDRFCVDYRRINALTKRDVYPLPRIDDALEALGGGNAYFTTLDLNSGFWQVPLAEADKEKTAFTTHLGLFEFNVLSMGLTNAPPTFQRLMDLVLAGLQWDNCLVYLDDVIVFSPTFDQHLIDLERVFIRLHEANLKLKPRKCSFARRKVDFLGHIVSIFGIEADPAKLRAISEFPRPTTQTQARSFLGVAGYYRKFIRGFATIAQPLHTLTGKNSKFLWTPECEASFVQLKAAMTSPPVLRYPDTSLPFVIHTDASRIGIGAVLSQVENSTERPVSFASRVLQKSEKNYPITELEALAVVWGVKMFHHYVYGYEFTIVTDHAALKWLLETEHESERLRRWSLKLSVYRVEIQHRAGKKHANADALSRNPVGYVALLVTDDIRQKQRGDPDFSPVFEYLATKTLPNDPTIAQRTVAEASAYVLSNGTLYHIQHHNRRAQDFWQQLAVPKELRRSALQEVHDSSLAGHFAFKKTFRRLQEKYYWPGMYKDTDKWCRFCTRCNERRLPNPRLREPLHAIPIGGPFHRMGVDVVGPLPQSQKGNAYILVFMDYFTKWPEAFAIPNQQATTVADILFEEIICRHGAPVELLSDRGPNFLSEIVQELCILMRIRKTYTTPYHPQCNGLVERFNRTLVDMLAKLVDHDSEWQMYLHPTLLAYRSTIHSSIGESPFYMVHGRDPRLPSDDFDPSAVRFADTDNYLVTLSGRLTQAWASAKANIEVAQERYAQQYDKRARIQPFTVGDLVSMRRPPHAGSKFHSKWDSPYRILRIIEPNIVIRLADDPDAAVITAHKNKIVPFRRTHIPPLPSNSAEHSSDAIASQQSDGYSADAEDFTVAQDSSHSSTEF